MCTRHLDLGLQLWLWFLPGSTRSLRARPAVRPAGSWSPLTHNRLVHAPSLLPRGLRRLTLHHNRIERVPGYVFAHVKPGLELPHLSHNSPHADGGHGVSCPGLPTSLAELRDHNQLQAIPRGLLRLRGLQVSHLSHSKIRWGPAPTPIMLSQHAALPARGERGS